MVETRASHFETQPATRKRKRGRNHDSGIECSFGELNSPLKRSQKKGSVKNEHQSSLIQHWLDKLESIELNQSLETVPRKSSGLPSPDDSVTTISRRSEQSSASVHDPDYRQSLSYHSVYIDHRPAPLELRHRAKRLVSRPRSSPGLDNEEVGKLTGKSRHFQNDGEQIIRQRLATHLIPIDDLPDELDVNSDQPWTKSVALPSLHVDASHRLPLPKPRPDLAFGYSEKAFSESQNRKIWQLGGEDVFGQSYAVPDSKLRFPFLTVEFISQAKGGTHWVASNQVAVTGAVALKGQKELMRRSFHDFDYNEPNFFSITMDHELARLNVHWAEEGGNFHVESLSQHLLTTPEGIRAVSRAVKNILEYATDKRLRNLCKALDDYGGCLEEGPKPGNRSTSKSDRRLGTSIGLASTSRHHYSTQERTPIASINSSTSRTIQPEDSKRLRRTVKPSRKLLESREGI